MRSHRLFWTASLAAVLGLSAAVAQTGAVAPAPQAPVKPAATGSAVATGTSVTTKREGSGKPEDASVKDKKTLEGANLKADDTAGLIGFLKSRMPSETDRGKLEALIARLGDDSFEVRQKASAELVKAGGTAVASLKSTAKDPKGDPEVVWRAGDCLRQIEKATGQSEVISAAVRTLAKSKDPQVVPALLAFLPLADSPSMLDLMQEALVANAVIDGKANPAILDALKSEKPATRRLAGVALIEGGPAGKAIRIPDAYPKVLELLKDEKDTNTRFALIRTLLVTAQEKEAVGLLIDLLPEMNRGQIWQAEDLLVQLPGKDHPKARCLTATDSKKKAATAWKEWWEKSAATADLAKAGLKQRIQGYFVMVTPDPYNGQNGSVIEYAHDMTPRWRVGGLQSPTDAVITTDGRVWVAEQGKLRVTERDMTGKLLSSIRIQVEYPGGGKNDTTPYGLEATADGGLLINCRNAVALLDKDGKEVWKHGRPNGQFDVLGATKLKSGQTAIALMNGGLRFLDEKGKEVEKKSVTTGPPNNNSNTTNIVATGDDKVLVAEQQQLVEYDVTTGKAVWTGQVNWYPSSVQRLPNGNTLFVDMNQRQVREITPDKQTAWTHTVNDPNFYYNFRAFVR